MTRYPLKVYSFEIMAEHLLSAQSKVVARARNAITGAMNSKGAINLAKVGEVIPEADFVIHQYKDYINSMAMPKIDPLLNGIVAQRIAAFRDGKKSAIDQLYGRTFDQFNKTLDDFTGRIVRTRISVSKMKESADANFEAEAASKERAMASQTKERIQEKEEELAAYKEEIDRKVADLDLRMESETDRVTKHYERIFHSRLDSLTMTEAALQKAKREVEESQMKHEEELKRIQQKHNETLSHYREDLIMKTLEEQKKVRELQQEVDEILEQQSKLAPELERQWKDREAEFNKKFKAADEEWECNMKEKLAERNRLEREIGELTRELDEFRLTSVADYNNMKEGLETKLTELIEERDRKVDEEVDAYEAKFKKKVQLLKESLQKINESAAKDEMMMLGRLKDKDSAHNARRQMVEEEQAKFVSELKEQISGVKAEIDQVKLEWQQEHDDTEVEYNQDITEVNEKRDKENQYFQTRMETLKKELHRIIQENARIRHEYDPDELLELQAKNKISEDDLNERLTHELEDKVNERVALRMRELKQRHGREIDRLMTQKRNAEADERRLNTRANELASTLPKRPAHKHKSHTTGGSSNDKQSTKETRVITVRRKKRTTNQVPTLSGSSIKHTENDIIQDECEYYSDEEQDLAMGTPAGTSKTGVIGTRSNTSLGNQSTTGLPDKKSSHIASKALNGVQPKSGVSVHATRSSNAFSSTVRPESHSRFSNSTSNIGKRDNAWVDGSTSGIFSETPNENWQEETYNACKSLKQDEATAIKNLDDSRQDFKAAVEKTAELKARLIEATEIYQEAIEKAEGKSDAELADLRDVLIEKEKEIASMEHQFEENERELKRRTHQIEQAEDKLSELRSQLANEKQKIREFIRLEYQPVIRQEQRRAELMVSQIERLRNEMEMEMEIAQHDLHDVETSNAAMEDSLREETERQVQQLQIQICQELRAREDEVTAKISAEEAKQIERMEEIAKVYEIEEQGVIKQWEAKISEEQAIQKENITKINDYCIDIISRNSEKKVQIQKLEEIRCDTCPTLERTMKKLEKKLVNMQLAERALELTEENHTDVCDRFHPEVK